MIEIPRHNARIYWSDALQRRGLPTSLRGIDPAWPAGATPVVDEGWSLVYEFDHAPSEQGSPSLARVGFLMEAAPHTALAAGARLQLHERGTQQYALVEILD